MDILVYKDDLVDFLENHFCSPEIIDIANEQEPNVKSDSLKDFSNSTLEELGEKYGFIEDLDNDRLIIDEKK